MARSSNACVPLLLSETATREPPIKEATMTMKKTMLTAAALLAVPGLAMAWHQPAPPSGLVPVQGFLYF